jgi:hypothetical protein
VDGCAGWVVDVAAYRQTSWSANQGVAVRREWELDDLIASRMLVDADQEQLVKLHPPSLVELRVDGEVLRDRGRFPRHVGELPPMAVDFVAR